MIKILVVDDSSFMISVIKRIVESVSDIQVIGSARTGREGVDKVKELKPDCVTMDINMPEMDGVEAVREIMADSPAPIVMLSAYSGNDADFTLKALEYGAVDFIQKPNGEISTNLESIKEELIRKIRAAVKSKLKKISSLSFRKQRTPRLTDSSIKRKKALVVVTIGISTGGPRLLKELIPLFREDVRAAILVSQHMPPGYTAKLAEQLNELTKLEVVEAKNLMEINEGKVYICPGDSDMTIVSKKIILCRPGKNTVCTPSVDVMFESAANEYKNKCIGVILTGMGNDGTKGLKFIKDNGGYLIAQNESTSTIFGMPKSAIETGLIDDILPARLIPVKIQRWVEGKLR